MNTKPGSISSSPILPSEPQEGEIFRLGEAAAPRSLSEQEILSLKEQARSFVTGLESATGSQEMILMDNLANLGMPVQRAAGGELDLVRRQIVDQIDHRDASSSISRDLVDLRLALNEINPQLVSRQDRLHRLFSALPFFGMAPAARRVLERIAVRYEAVSRQVQVIETRLGEGRRMLARDNIELRKMYEQIERQVLPVEKAIFFGELLLQELDQQLANSSDPLKRAHLQSTQHDVAMRVQDLRVMLEVFNQYFVSIDLTRQNNNRLAQAVERTLSLATHIVVVGLAIQTALGRQKRVLEATQKTREFLGTMLAENAAAIRKYTQEIGDVVHNPVIALDKIIEAHGQLSEALQLVDQLEQRGTESARQNILRLTELSAGLQQKALALHRTAERPGMEVNRFESQEGGS